MGDISITQALTGVVFSGSGRFWYTKFPLANNIRSIEDYCIREFSAIFLLGRWYSRRQAMHSPKESATERAEVYNLLDSHVAEETDSTVPKIHLRLHFSGVQCSLPERL